MPSVVTMTGPGTATVTDDAAVAIAAQTTALSTLLTKISDTQIGYPNVPGTLLNSLATMAVTLSKIEEQDKSISKAITDLNIAIGTLAAAQSEANAIQSVAAANQIATNNFQMAVTKDALKRGDIPEPVMPTIKEQLEEAVKNGLSLNVVATANGAITTFIKSTTSATATWIAGTEAYQTVASYVSKAKESILSILPPSASTVKVAASVGKPQDAV